MNFTEESVKQLSPEDASTKAGMQLATTAKWDNACHHEKALWGECKGSGKNPYFTQVDLTNIAFKCSCPSRKFPCKHGLGLLFLYVKQPGYFKQTGDLHEKVSEWLDKRHARTETKTQKEEKPVDEKAQKKRAEQREDKVAQGIEKLDTWMKDVIRTGIQNLPQQQYTAFKNIASGMVDAQAPGLAGMLRGLEDINYFEENWEQNFMRQFSKIYFILQTYDNKDNLSAEWQQELRSQIGWNTTKEELAELPVLNDTWNILHTEKTPFEKLISEKTWLYGQQTRQFYYQLQFYTPQQAFSTQMLITGNCIEAKAVAYPAVAARRIWIKDSIPHKSSFTLQGDASLFETILTDVSAAKATNPLQEEFPFILHTITLALHNGQWYLSDAAQKSIPVIQQEKTLWKIWALTRGLPFDAFGIYSNGEFKILSLYHQNRYYTF
jgi:SWIM zinc finger